MKFLFVVLFVLSQIAFSQHQSKLLISSLFDDEPTYLQVNPAQHLKKGVHLQLHYENRFLLKAISPKYLFITRTKEKHQWTLGFSDWGTTYYKEMGFHLNYGMKLTPVLSIGIHGLFMLVKRYISPKHQLFVFPALGMNYAIGKKNSFFTSLRVMKQDVLNYQAYFGVTHQFKTKCKILLLGSSNIRQKIVASGTLYYEIKQGSKLSFRVGVNDFPLGVAYTLNWKKLAFNFAAFYHQQLGVSNHIGANYYTLQ